MGIARVSLFDKFVPTLHKISILRTLAKQLLRGYTLRQSFYGGSICFDAVEHSWTRTGVRRYETFDQQLQDKLLSLSYNYEVLIDIGCNIGAMTLSVLLRNQSIKAVCIDPNSRAISLLNKTIIFNNLGSRVDVIEAAVSDQEGTLNFDETGSVTGHISHLGKQVSVIEFSRLINKYSTEKCLIKIDIEGFEVNLLNSIKNIQNKKNICLAIELHPFQFNEIGHPTNCLQSLLESGTTVTDMDGNLLSYVENENFTQVIVGWDNV